MNWMLSWIALAAGVAIFALAIRISNRPADPLKPRLAPWSFIAILALVWNFLVIIHLLNLAGLDTSQLPSRTSR